MVNTYGASFSNDETLTVKAVTNEEYNYSVTCDIKPMKTYWRKDYCLWCIVIMDVMMAQPDDQYSYSMTEILLAGIMPNQWPGVDRDQRAVDEGGVLCIVTGVLVAW